MKLKFTYSLRRFKIQNLIADVNNPRVLTDQASELLTLSLKKFGLLSPLYITGTCVLLSGHQRSKILSALGETEVLVVVAKNVILSNRNAVNFAFNKELQEMSNREFVVTQAEIDQLKERLRAMPDIDDKYKYLRETQMVHVDNVKPTFEATKKMQQNSQILLNYAKVMVPLIVDEDMNIINGNARFQEYRTRFDHVPVTIAPNIYNEIFRYITASYSLNDNKDNIRIEQRRHFVKIKRDGGVMGRALVGKKLSLSPPEFQVNYLNGHYPRIFDFGSGNAKQTQRLRELGVDITLFEPFATAKQANNFSIKLSYDIMQRALDKIADPRPFDLVVANAVLNSVPFKEDADKVVVLLKFLSTGAKSLIVSSRTPDTYYRQFKRTTAMSLKKEADDDSLSFITASKKSKVQHFHSPKDLMDLFGPHGWVIRESYNFYRGDNPRYIIDFDKLIEAVKFEFGMKYIDRTFKDVQEKAVQIFTDKFRQYESEGRYSHEEAAYE